MIQEHKGMFKYYVILLGGGGESLKRSQKITGGVGGFTKRSQRITITIGRRGVACKKIGQTEVVHKGNNDCQEQLVMGDQY